MSTLISSNIAGSPYLAPGTRENRIQEIIERLDQERTPTKGLSAEQLAARRAYTGNITADVEALKAGNPEAGEKSHPQTESNFHLSEAPDPNSTPRYEAEQRFAESALQECQGCANFSNRSPQAQQAILGMVARLQQMQESQAAKGTRLEVDGVSVVRMFLQEFVSNPKVTDEMLIKMGNVQLKDLARTPEEQKDIEERVPGSRDLITHKMAVALLSAMTGIPPEILSKQCPDLGLSGTPDYWLWEPGTEGCGQEKEDFELSNILHDTTDFLQDAGVDGLNLAVWDDASSEGSAWNSWWGSIEGDRYAEEA